MSDNMFLDLLVQLNGLMDEAWTTNPLAGGVPLIGPPSQADFGWERFGGTTVPRFGEAPESRARRDVFYADSTEAFFARFPSADPATGPAFVSFTQRTFPDAGTAEVSASDIVENLRPYDEVNDINRILVPNPEPLPGAGNTVLDVYTWNFGDRVVGGHQLTGQFGQQVVSLVIVGLDPVADDTTPQDVQYDPEAARRLLDQAGFVDRDSDGVVDGPSPTQRNPLGLGTSLPTM